MSSAFLCESIDIFFIAPVIRPIGAENFPFIDSEKEASL